MKRLWDFKKVFSNLEPEGQRCDIIIGVTRLLLLGPFYTIQTNFMYFFAHGCISILGTCPPELVSMLSNSASRSSIGPTHFSSEALILSEVNSSLDTLLSSPVSILKRLEILHICIVSLVSARKLKCPSSARLGSARNLHSSGSLRAEKFQLELISSN